MFTALLTFLICVIIAYVIQDIIKPKKYPPGPKWYPFVGSSHIVESMTKKHGSQVKAFRALAKQYSTQVLGLKLGSDKVVVVYGEKNLRQVFTEKQFDGRPDNFFLRLRCLGKRLGITFTDGPLWKEHRHFTVKQLRNVGFSKTNFEMDVQNELQVILKQISKKNVGVNPTILMPPAVMNVLWKYVAGEQIKEDRLKYLMDLMGKRSAAFTISGGWLNQFPWIRFIFPEMSGYSLINKINLQISDIISEAVQKHREKKIEGDDFIYSFMKEIDNNTEYYTEEQLSIICLDLLIAGSKTTSTVVEFAIFAALRNRNMQEKIYNEIIEVLDDRPPCWEDNYKMPYTSAFLLEVQRYYGIVPLAGPRRTLSDTSIDGYLIPKETTIFIGLQDLHFDQDYWSNAKSFDPERFRNEDGSLKYTTHFYPFGHGRRRCPGDSLARSFIFQIFVGILQKYKIECSNGVLPPDETLQGIILYPKPYTADFIERI